MSILMRTAATGRDDGRNLPAPPRPLRAGTFLAPHLFWFYEFVVQRLGRRLGVSVELTQPSNYVELSGMDLAFVCGLAYVERGEANELEPLAAPVLRGRRYGGRPVYYSDVIVRKGSGLRS